MPSLRELDEHLLALIETLEACENDDARQACTLDIQQYVQATAAKVDGNASMVLHMRDQIAVAKSEAKRFKAREDFYERVLERLESSVIRVMVQSDRTRFDGNRHAFLLAKRPASVVTPNEAAVPVRFKTAKIEIPGEMWERTINLVREHDREFSYQLLGAMKATFDLRKPEIADSQKRCYSDVPEFNEKWLSLGTNVEAIGKWLLFLYQELSQKLIGEGEAGRQDLEDFMTRISNWRQGGSYVTARQLAFEMLCASRGIKGKLEDPVPGADLAIGNVRLDIK